MFYIGLLVRYADMAPQLTEIDKGKIIAYHNAGWNVTTIGREIGRAHKTVTRALWKYHQHGEITRKPGSGRRQKLSLQTQRAMGRAVQANRFLTATALQTEFRLNEGPNRVCSRTIHRAITRVRGFVSYWAAKKPFISERNRRKRLAWCHDKLNWTIEDWRKVMWTDESPFCLGFSGKLRVWRLHNERYYPRCMQGTLKHDKKIMVWGAFAAHGVGHLHRIEGTMDRHIYRQILIDHMRPSLEQLFPDDDGIFQQDNDPKHTALSVRFHLNSNLIPQFNIIPFMFGNKNDDFRWPAQSPDLNPIENLWSSLDRKITNRRPNSEAELFAIVLQAWNNLDPNLLTALVDSMPSRVAAVIANNGYPTKY